MPSKYDDYSEDELAEAAEEFGENVHKMESQIQNGFIGQEDVIRKILLTVMGGGNVLLEGVPGLGKSLLVEQLSKTVETDEMNMIQDKMNRVQFTPDLLPADIIGVEAYNEEKGFYVEKGPIFANFILADEINRAPPKVQSAMLEAMQEHKVSIGDETFDLPEPFFVMATQNPTEQGGSLHPDETVYMNGKLWSAEEALQYAKGEGKLIDEEGDRRIYESPCQTNNLSYEGKIEQTDCNVYEKDYSGKIHKIKTRTGRRIKVNSDHPVLVNDSGKLLWKKASEIEEGDFLVNPETLDLPEEEFEEHSKTIKKLKDEFNSYTRGEVKKSLEKLEKGDHGPDIIDCARVVSGLSKKELAEKSGADYEMLLNYLRGAENGAGEKAADVLRSVEREPDSYVESFNIHRISDAWSTSDAGFFVGFTLAEGHLSETTVEVSQKNYPELIERWIRLAEKKGLEVDTREKDGVKHAKIGSKPFIEYLKKRYNLDEPERLLSAPREFKLEFIDSFMLSESYFENDTEEDNVRITMTQKDRDMVNLISHLLSSFGIRPKIYDEGRVFRLRISDSDLRAYAGKFTWPGDEPEFNEGSSSYRTLPVDTEKLNSIVENLGLKNDGDMVEREWYPGYRMARKRGVISEHKLKEFCSSVRTVLNKRRSEEYDSTREKALSAGISITEVVEGTNLSKYQVWKDYDGEKTAAGADDFVSRERDVRLSKAERDINYLEKLVKAEVFYDPVQELESEQYEGPVIGLSVPETHNYVAGLGGCGINHNTYPLPEAQIDRFMFKIYLDYPKKVNERKIIDMNANIMDDEDFGVNPVVTQEEIRDMQEFSKHVKVSEEVKAYIVDLVDASRNPGEYDLDYADYIEWGCTPRASINLALAGRSHAMYHKRHYVTPEDIRAVIEDVFIHRIMLNYEGEAQGIEVADIIEEIVDHVPVR